MTTSKFKIKTYQIILAQIIAILIWVSITVIQWATNPKGSPGLFIPLVVRTIEAVSVLLVSGIFVLFLEKASREVRVAPFRFLLIVLIYVGAMLANLLSLLIRNLIGFAPPKIEGFFFIQSLHFYIPIYILLIVYAMTKNRLEAIHEKENKLKAESLAQQAKWLMLRYQVNPHFLFNALNTIRAVVGIDDIKAKRMITDMSQYFRYSLSSQEKELVTIADEIEAVNHCLEIQHARFHDRLETRIHISEKVRFILIPIFTIQTLVENALRYGLKSTEDKLKIVIECSLKDNSAYIIVKNTGHIIKDIDEQVNGTEKGIENFKERLNYLYPNQNEFSIEEKDDFVIAKISIHNIENNQQHLTKINNYI